MFFIANPRQTSEEQKMSLEALLFSGYPEIQLISHHDHTDLPKNVFPIRVKPLFRSSKFLRGFFYPFAPYLNMNTKGKDEILFIHDEIFSTSLMHAQTAKKKKKFRVFTYSFENRSYSPLMKLAGCFFAPYVDVAFCPTEEARRRLSEIGVQKTVLCPFPVLDPPKEIQKIQKIKRIGFIGRLVEEKGVLLFCEASKAFVESHFQIYGKGPLEKEILKYAVNFRGLFEYAKLDEVLKDFDLLIIPSYTTARWKEQFCRVAVEAMSRGIPVIASKCGALKEIIGDESLLFKENNVQALVDKIRQMLSLNSEQLASLSRSLRDCYERRFNLSTIQEIVRKEIENF